MTENTLDQHVIESVAEAYQHTWASFWDAFPVEGRTKTNHEIECDAIEAAIKAADAARAPDIRAAFARFEEAFGALTACEWADGHPDRLRKYRRLEQESRQNLFALLGIEE